MESKEPIPRCPCCRELIKLNRRSSLINHLMFSYKFAPISEANFFIFSNFIRELCAMQCKYIYYDNPGLSLYIYDVKVNSTHYCSWCFSINTI